MKKVLLFVLIFGNIFVNRIKAEDTIRIMQYNLLYYGKQYNDCTTSNNNIDNKNNYLKTIVEHIKPDIFGVNELDGNGSYPEVNDAQYLLDNALNINGISHYRKTNAPEAFLSNIIFYNTNKVILKSSHSINVSYGGLAKYYNAYKFYYNSDNLETTGDTAYFYCVVAHFKAGNLPENLTQKAYESERIMDFFEKIGEAGNYIVMGDFNVYSPTEECFQNLINPDNSLYTFYDPANQIGEWSGNSDYRFYHTQSTRLTVPEGGCPSSGGMDDRFDFIMASGYIMDGTDHFQYIDGSYKAIGQDGSKFNQALNIVSNTTVPTNVAQALYLMSDHLPVYMEMKVDQNLGEPLSVEKSVEEEVKVFYNNPVNDLLNLSIKTDNKKDINCELVSLSGKIIFSKTIRLIYGLNKTDISVSDVDSGIYILKLHDGNNQIYSGKMVKL